MFCFVIFLNFSWEERHRVIWNKKTKLCKYWWHSPQLYLWENDQHRCVYELRVCHPYLLIFYHPRPVLKAGTQIKKRNAMVIPSIQNILLPLQVMPLSLQHHEAHKWENNNCIHHIVQMYENVMTLRYILLRCCSCVFKRGHYIHCLPPFFRVKIHLVMEPLR